MSAAHRRRVGIAAAAAAVCALAACTSDGDGSRSTAPATSDPQSSAPGSTAPPSASSSSRLPGFAGLDGTLLVAGPTRARADVYRVASGRISRVTRSADVTAVGSGGGRTVVGVREPDGAEGVRELRGSGLVALRGDGFDPAVSGGGAIATVRVDSGTTTPGISKPKGFVVSVRRSVSASDRVVLRTPGSAGSPRWLDDRTLVVALAAGDDAQVAQLDTRTGRRTDLGRVSGGGELELTASSRAVTVATDGGAVLLTVRDRRRHAFPRDWTPLCWPSPTTALATRSGQLATVSLTPDGTAGTPRVLGPLPAGTSAYAAACGD